MNIELNLNEDFSNKIKELSEKYGEDFEFMNGLSNSRLNFTDYIDNFLKNQNVVDVVMDSSSNSTTHDVRTMLADMVKPHNKLLSFNKIFTVLSKKYGLETANKWFENEWSGASYLHDSASCAFIPYCYAYDLEPIVNKGLFFINMFKTEPPKHLTTYNDHVLEFISWAANRTSGAVGLPSYLVYSYYFWYNDVRNNFYLKDPESIMDRNYLIELFGGRSFPDGEYVIDHIEGIIEHQKVFMKVVSEIRSKTMMTFPVLTFSLLYQDGKFVDMEFARWCNKHNMQWFDSNFYVGSDVTSLSNCCRLISNTSKLNAFINSIGGTSLSIGSIKVNTINLRRIALESEGDMPKYFEILKERVDICVKVLDVVRDVITENIKNGLLPNYAYKLIELEKQYNTIGITAMYEAVNEFGLIDTDEFGNKSYSEKGLEFAKKILDSINKQKDSYEFNYSINIEAIPAERANVVLCQKDNEIFDSKYQYFIYSNQWIPLMEKCTLQEKVRLGSILDKECGGGQISHINLAGDFASEEQAWNLLNYIAKSGVIYFAYNKKISVCKSEHAFLSEICPKCGEKAADTYSRIVGFLVPLSAYSKERKSEFNKRKWFDLD